MHWFIYTIFSKSHEEEALILCVLYVFWSSLWFSHSFFSNKEQIKLSYHCIPDFLLAISSFQAQKISSRVQYITMEIIELWNFFHFFYCFCRKRNSILNVVDVLWHREHLKSSSHDDVKDDDTKDALKEEIKLEEKKKIQDGDVNVILNYDERGTIVNLDYSINTQ